MKLFYMKKVSLIFSFLVCISYLSFSQNVGIGTNTPAYKLDVKNGSINTDSLYRISSFPVLGIPGNANLFVGRQAGLVNTGTYNTFVGHLSGIANTTGNFNTFFGGVTGLFNSTGSSNAFFGTSAGYANNGSDNSFFGRESGNNNSSGSGNCFFGRSAGFSNGTGYSNIVIGIDALHNNLTTSNSIAIGDSALYNSFAPRMVAIGSKAGLSNTFGDANSFIGFQSGYANTTGSGNSFFGYESGHSNTTAGSNLFAGYQAGFSTTTGGANVFIGYYSGVENTSGTENVIIGWLAGSGLTGNITGIGNTMLGALTNPASSDLVNATAVGHYAKVGCSNCMALGGTVANGAQTRVGINNTAPQTDLHIIQQSANNFDNSRGIRLQSPNGTHWRVFLDPSSNYVFQYNTGLFSYIEPVGGTFVSNSDERLKKDISPLSDVLNKILLLQPKSYHYLVSSDANRFSYGFIAQEVEKLFPDFVFSSEDGIKGIAYSNFSVIAIKAIQEQQQLIEDQKQKIDHQQQQIEEMLKRIESLEKKN